MIRRIADAFRRKGQRILSQSSTARAAVLHSRKRGRIYALSAVGVFAALLAVASAESQPAPNTMRADEFADSIGVNVHVEYTDGDYADWRRVIESLNYLGVKEVRDSGLDRGNQGQDHYHYLAEAGMRFDLVLSRTDIPQVISEMAAFDAKYPGAVAAIEGVNEVNNAPWFKYKNMKGTPAAQAYQADIYAAVKADKQLKNKPVISFTDYPSAPGKADYRNIHPYGRQGKRPDDFLPQSSRDLMDQMPNTPVMATEFGYFTGPASMGWGGVSEAEQAAWILRGLAINAQLGVKRTYIYQLLDAYADPEGKDQEKHFGLFNRQFEPKPSAVAIRNTLRILRSEKGSAGRIPPLPAVDPGVQAMVLTANNQRYFVLLWADKGHLADIRFASKPKEIAIFDPLVDDKEIVTVSGVSGINIRLDEAPKILRVTAP